MLNKGDRRPIGLILGSYAKNILKKSNNHGTYISEVNDGLPEVRLHSYSFEYDEEIIPFEVMYRHMDPAKISGRIEANEINYPRNMLAFYKKGVRKIFATSSGGVYPNHTGKILIPNCADHSSQRNNIIHSPYKVVCCPSMHEPFSNELIKCIEEAAKNDNMNENTLHKMKRIILPSDLSTNKILYFETQGPFKETKDESEKICSYYANENDSIVFLGFVGYSESGSSKFFGIKDGEDIIDRMEYALICLATNPAQHITDKIEHVDNNRVRKEMKEELEHLLYGTIRRAYYLESNMVST